MLFYTKGAEHGPFRGVRTLQYDGIVVGRIYLCIADGKMLIWSGETERSLGYVHLKPTKRVKTDEITIRLKGAGHRKELVLRTVDE